jgi:hypothetical protein
MSSTARMYPVRQPKPSRFAGVAWTSLMLGIVGCCLIPIPILNNAGAIAGLVGVVLGIVGCCGTKGWVGAFGAVLSGLAVVGTLVIQKQWADDLNEIRDRWERDTQQIDREFADLDACMQQLEEWDGTGPAPECAP